MKTNIGTTGITKENSKKEIGKEVIYAVSLEWKNNNNNNNKNLLVNLQNIRQMTVNSILKDGLQK